MALLLPLAYDHILKDGKKFARWSYYYHLPMIISKKMTLAGWSYYYHLPMIIY